MKGKPVHSGTVSQGTMRLSDLIPTFMAVLHVNKREASMQLENDYAEIVNYYKVNKADPPLGDPMLSEAYELIQVLFQELDAISPEGHYFGAHPGDGSDFGWWPLEDMGGTEVGSNESKTKTDGGSRIHK